MNWRSLKVNLGHRVGGLVSKNHLLRGNEQVNFCDIIEVLTQAKLCDEPLFMQLTKLDAAFCQLDIDLYGLCSDCENEIEPERLAKDLLEQRCANKYEHQHRQELRLTH
jgi:DnaK suppressor protein